MLPALSALPGGTIVAYLGIAIALPVLVTRLLSAFRGRWPKKGEPPVVPYWIPWLGHALSYLLDINNFSDKVKTMFPNESIVTSVVGGRNYYMILDPKLASQLLRRPKVFAMEAFVLESHEAFGTPKHDLDLMKMGVPGLQGHQNDRDDGRRLWHGLSKVISECLDVNSSVRMASTFLQILTKNLAKEFPMDSKASWVTVDMRSFIMRQYLIASVPSLFGSHILEIWPTIYEDFWLYDRYTSLLLALPPKMFASKEYALRQKILNVLLQWERDARDNKNLDGLIADNVEWDEYWGARLLQQRTKLTMENGLSEMARASIQLTLLWGQNGNAIPVGTWLMIQCLVDPEVKRRVLTAIEECRKQDGEIDMYQIVTHSYLKSLFLEALRYSVAAPTMRVVLETTTLGGYTLKKGSITHIPGRTLQMDEKVWSAGDVPVQPSTFWDERFLDLERDANGGLNEKQPANSVFSKAAADPISLPIGTKSKEIRDRMSSFRPFGGGSHLCPGRYFAIYEIVAGMVTLLTDFDFEVDQGALQQNGMPSLNKEGIGGLQPDRKFMVRMKRK